MGRCDLYLYLYYNSHLGLTKKCTAAADATRDKIHPSAWPLAFSAVRYMLVSVIRDYLADAYVLPREHT